MAVASFLPFAGAQSANDTEEEAIQLDSFEVTEVPIEENIIPSSRPFNSVYGLNRSIVDTPRSVTIISREQLDAISIKTPRDFARLTSSSYTKSNFGAPTSPNLRGQEADLFVNGIRKGLTSNGNGLPINFNAVESVNIVKGPAGPVYGTSNYLGGYADLITKRAFFDGPKGEVSFTAGSYDTYYGQIDYGAPISDELAYRFSFSGEDTVGYYYRGKKQTQAFYGTITYRPSDNYELFLAGEFFNASYTENWGFNRPTQLLIDKGLYYPNAQTDAQYAAYVAQLGSPNGPGFSAGFNTFVPLDLANPVKLDRRQRLLAPGDDSEGQNFWAQAVQTWTLSDTLKVVNNTYFQWIDRNTFSSYHYSELMRDNWSLDNSLSVIYDTDTWGVNAGLRYRYQDVWSVNHFFNEPANFWDLTRDPNLNRVPDAGFVNNDDPIIPDQAPRGILNAWYYGGTGAGTDGYIFGPFAQFDFQPSENVIIDFGVGVDYVKATEVDPVGGASVYSLTDSVSLPNYSGAVVFKINETLSTYLNYGYSESHPAETGGRFDVGAFDTPLESELFEVGVKGAFKNNTLFASLAYFDRTFVAVNPDGSRDDVELNGFEFEINYQPNKNFYATFGYSFIDSMREAGFFATAYTADRADETGGTYITPTFPGPSNPSQLFEYPGNPRHQAVGLVSYKFTENFGMRANIVYTSKYFNGYDGMVLNRADGNTLFIFLDPAVNTFVVNSVQIPDQYEIDLTAFYETETWEAKITAFNVTDEDNWDSPNAGYGNGSVVAREPIRFEGTVTFKF